MNFLFSKSKIFLLSCLSFIIGIAIASFLPDKIIRQDIWWFAVLILSFVLIVLFRQNKIIRLAGLASLFLFLGIWRYSLSLPEMRSDKIWFYNGSEVKVSGIVIKEPDARRNFTKYTVETSRQGGMFLPKSPLPRPREAGDIKNVSGKILITANLYPAYNYGDKLEIKCKLEAPQPFNDFAYDKYLARYDIYSVCYYPEIKLVAGFNSPSRFEEGGGVVRTKIIIPIFSKIFSLKNKLSGKISRGMNEPEAGLARGIVLGERADIDQKINDNFSRTGLTHLIAISGMNISILAVLATQTLLWLGLWRRQAFYFTLLFLIVYLILIGLPASAVRAGIMGILVLWAFTIGRISIMTNMLLLAAALMLFSNPKLLRYDVGFQLSFLAVLGIIYLYPKLNIWFEKKGWAKLKFARDALNITLAAQVFTLPIIAYNFSIVSIISPLANLLVLWTMPVIMAVTLAALPFSFILSNVSFLFFLPAQLLLKYTVAVAELLARIPGAYLGFNFRYAGLLAILYYIIVIFIIFKAERRKFRGAVIISH